MAGSQGTPWSSNPIVGIVAAMIVVLIIVGGVIVAERHARFEAGAPYVPQGQATQARGDWANRVALQSQGDFSKLSPKDQHSALWIWGPDAPQTLRDKYNALQQASASGTMVAH